MREKINPSKTVEKELLFKMNEVDYFLLILYVKYSLKKLHIYAYSFAYLIKFAR